MQHTGRNFKNDAVTYMSRLDVFTAVNTPPLKHNYPPTHTHTHTQDYVHDCTIKHISTLKLNIHKIASHTRRDQMSHSIITKQSS